MTEHSRGPRRRRVRTAPGASVEFADLLDPIDRPEVETDEVMDVPHVLAEPVALPEPVESATPIAPPASRFAADAMDDDRLPLRQKRHRRHR